MASSNVIAAALVVIFAVSLPTLSRATDHIVGDEFGWTPGFNYTTWAQGKEFRVRDTLVFKYTAGENSVFKVNGPQFQQCAFPPPNEAMTTGTDVVSLATEGRKWYVSGAGNGANCRAGQKLVVVVLPAELQAPSSAPSGLYTTHSHSSPPEMSWEPTASHPSSWDSPSPSPSEGATPSATYSFFNRFLK